MVCDVLLVYVKMRTFSTTQNKHKDFHWVQC